jgi:hypothetical protein
MDVNDRLAMEIGKPALRAALAEAQIEQMNGQLQAAQSQIEDLTYQLRRKTRDPENAPEQSENPR